MMVIDNKFELKQKVYLRSDPEGRPRFVVSIIVNVDGILLYELRSGAEISMHYDFEIDEKPEVL